MATAAFVVNRCLVCDATFTSFKGLLCHQTKVHGRSESTPKKRRRRDTVVEKQVEADVLQSMKARTTPMMKQGSTWMHHTTEEALMTTRDTRLRYHPQ